MELDFLSLVKTLDNSTGNITRYCHLKGLKQKADYFSFMIFNEVFINPDAIPNFSATKTAFFNLLKNESF